jgi:N-acyl-D-aspartate/D-glutamate deacylase
MLSIRVSSPSFTVPRTKTVCVTTPRPVVVKKNKKVVPRTRLQVAETLNGRLAMLGVVSGNLVEYTTHATYLNQLETNAPYVVLLSGLIGYATLRTMYLEDMEASRPFTMNIETLNGRMAMMGILAKFLYEFLTM